MKSEVIMRLTLGAPKCREIESRLVARCRATRAPTAVSIEFRHSARPLRRRASHLSDQITAVGQRIRVISDTRELSSVEDINSGFFWFGNVEIEDAVRPPQT